MEIKAFLVKPYTKEERKNFIITYQRNLGYNINETDTELQAFVYTEEELEKQKQERIAMLFLTAADVERGIYKAKGMDFEDIINLISANPVSGLDVKALKIELKANHFYRGNPYVEAIGSLLGFTKEQLDKFFKDGNYEHLLSEEVVEENSSISG